MHDLDVSLGYIGFLLKGSEGTDAGTICEWHEFDLLRGRTMEWKVWNIHDVPRCQATRPK